MIYAIIVLSVLVVLLSVLLTRGVRTARAAVKFANDALVRAHQAEVRYDLARRGAERIEARLKLKRKPKRKPK